VELNDVFRAAAKNKAVAVWKEYQETVRMADSPEDVKTAERILSEVPSFSIPDMQRVYEDEIKRLKESDSE
jgi:hypothetical protein